LLVPAECSHLRSRIKDVSFSGKNGIFHRDDYRNGFWRGAGRHSLQRLHTVAASGRRYRQPAGATGHQRNSWSDTSITVTGIAAKKGDSMRVGVYNQNARQMWIHGRYHRHTKDGTPIITTITRSGSGATLMLTITGSGFWSRAGEFGVTISVHRFSCSRTTTLSYRAATAFHGTAASAARTIAMPFWST